MDPNQNKQNRGDGQKPQNFGQNIMIIIIAAVLSMFLMSWGSDMMRDRSEEEVSYDQFYEMVESGEVESVNIGDWQISISVKKK